MCTKRWQLALLFKEGNIWERGLRKWKNEEKAVPIGWVERYSRFRNYLSTRIVV